MQGTGLVLLTAGLVLGTSGVAGAKTVSDKKYAKSICGAITGVSNTIDQIQPANSGDPATAQAQILASTDQLLASLNEAKAKAANLSPSDGGKKVTKLFDQYFQSSVDGVTAARQKLAAADPSNVAFAADIARVHGGAADPPGDDRRSLLQAVVEPEPPPGAEEGEDLLEDRHGLRRLSSISSGRGVDTVRECWGAPMSIATLLHDGRRTIGGTGQRR